MDAARPGVNHSEHLEGRVLILQIVSLSLDTQATPSGSEEGQSNGAFHLGRLGQLGLQNLPHTEPGRDGGGRRHHPAQTTVY